MKLRLLFVAAALSAAPVWSKTFLIDVRTPQEYAEAHLRGAINIDHTEIGQRISRVGATKDDEIILYCRSGRRSALAAEALKGMGYRKVKDYGGIDDARPRLAPSQ